jgi:hypothetical protein
MGGPTGMGSRKKTRLAFGRNQKPMKRQSMSKLPPVLTKLSPRSKLARSGRDNIYIYFISARGRWEKQREALSTRLAFSPKLRAKKWE